MSALARMVHYLEAQPALPDLSEGLCVGSKDADDWHADMHRNLRDRERARALCLRCPVMDACRDYAVSDPGVQGTWGGLTEKERIRLRARHRPEMRLVVLVTGTPLP